MKLPTDPNELEALYREKRELQVQAKAFLLAYEDEEQQALRVLLDLFVARAGEELDAGPVRSAQAARRTLALEHGMQYIVHSLRIPGAGWLSEEEQGREIDSRFEALNGRAAVAVAREHKRLLLRWLILHAGAVGAQLLFTAKLPEDSVFVGRILDLVEVCVVECKSVLEQAGELGPFNDGSLIEAVGLEADGWAGAQGFFGAMVGLVMAAASFVSGKISTTGEPLPPTGQALASASEAAFAREREGERSH